MNLKSLIKLKKKKMDEITDKLPAYENAWDTYILVEVAKEVKYFLSQSIQSAYQLAIKDVEKLECMKEKVDDTLTFNSFVNITEVKNELRNQIKQQLQSLLKEKV